MLSRAAILALTCLGGIFIFRSDAGAHEILIAAGDDRFVSDAQVVLAGDQVVMTAPVLMPSGECQWYHDDAPIPGANTTKLTLASATVLDSGNYQWKDALRTSSSIALSVVPPAPHGLDPTFSASVSDDVRSADPIAATPSGGVIIRESLTGGGQRYERLEVSGARDSTWVFPAEAGAILAVLSDGGVVTTQAPYVLDVAGAPVSFTLPPGFDAASPLTAAAIQSDGGLLLAQGARLVRLDRTFHIDTAFRFSDSRVATIDFVTPDPAGNILLAGESRNQADRFFLRLTSSGSLDAHFTPPAQLPVYLNGENLTMPFGCRRIFPNVDGGYLAEGNNSAVLRLTKDGTLDTPGILVAPQFVAPRSPILQAVAADSAGWFFALWQFMDGQSFVRITPAGQPDPVFYTGPISYARNPQTVSGLNSILVAPDNRLYVGGTFIDWNGHATNYIARLRSSATIVTAPVLTPTVAPVPRRGSTVEISFEISGNGPFTVEWLALDGQPLQKEWASVKTLPQQILATLGVPNFSRNNLGRYQARVTSEGGTVLTQIVTLSLENHRVSLANISGRAKAGDGENTMIAGTVNWQGGVHGLLRGVGPSLDPLGVHNFCRQPKLKAFDDLRQEISLAKPANTRAAADELAAELGATPLLADSKDERDVVSLGIGLVTFHLQDESPGEHGIAVLEFYSAIESGVQNLSFRAETAPGEDTAIAGFIIRDPTDFNRPARVLLRAVGPTLLGSGVVHPLADPVLTVFNHRGEVIASNDNWDANLTSADASTLAATIAQLGAYELPAHSKDASLLLDLPPGAYTMHATGGTGVVLLEVYFVQ